MMRPHYAAAVASGVTAWWTHRGVQTRICCEDQCAAGSFGSRREGAEIGGRAVRFATRVGVNAIGPAAAAITGGFVSLGGAAAVFSNVADGRLRAAASSPQAVHGVDRMKGVSGPAASPASRLQGAFTLDSAARCVSAKRPRSISEPVRHDCGEDAFFMAQPTATGVTVGIADGVGSWSDIGIDPAVFAWELMLRCEAVAEENMLGDEPKAILAKGFERMLASPSAPFGSSTACVASLNSRSGMLQIANLGDSGAMLLRGGSACVLQSTEQQHYFNCPFQLTNSPDEDVGLSDTPELSATCSTQVREGDLLILATDGFLDNVWRQDYLKITTALSVPGSEATPGEIAESLVKLAVECSKSPTKLSPFGHSASKHGHHYDGGKPDDITVIVARVVQSPPA
eukprot:TRINITY_DN29474_c0_g1_i1.p1 TRINITY_DN29474_c0_g1~~TRINITY_DN29474_c0_g1_i1.p1  ORF type:complete len:399 (+),score=77.98 TRINITY_DN29474_c0_g1_i1:50-1246(+)